MTEELIDTFTRRGWDSFVPYINPSCLGVPAEIIGLSARDSAIEFTERTGILKQEITLDFQANVQEYPIEVDGCYNFLALHRVCTPSGIVYAPNHSPHCCRTGGYTFFYDSESLIISPVPVEDEAKAAKITITVSIKRDALYCPEIIYERYVDAVKYGALSKILNMNGHPWFDSGGAIIYRKMFKNEVNRARLREERSMIRGPMIATAKRFV